MKTVLFSLALLSVGVAARTIAADAPLSFDLGRAFPAPNATRVCPDTPLRLTFPAPPVLGTSGTIRIVDASDNSTVETIDVSSPTATKEIGGLPLYKYYPVILSGNDATIFPKNGVLSYHKTYYVMIDAGVFKSAQADYSALTDPKAWRFTTKDQPPAVDSAKLTIAADGTGDFCTVQGALDFVPDGNTAPRTLFVRKGLYTEMVFFTNKHSITVLGEDRHETVIAYATNANFNPSSGNPFGSANPNPSAASPRTGGGNIYHRGVFLAHRVTDLTVANLTIHNTTPQGGSQAEAIILNGTPTAHAILKDVDLYSYQDTLQINGQAYLNNCYFEGDVDFMWGTGPCFFENCSARSLRSGAYYTQIRNPPTNHGYVYLHCTFDGGPGVTGNYFSRIEPNRFPASEVVLVDCVVTDAAGAVGWQLQNGRDGKMGDASNVHFWEYNSHGADGTPVDVSKRLAISRQLKQPDDAKLIADYSDPTFVLGDDWKPKNAAIFSRSP